MNTKIIAEKFITRIPRNVALLESDFIRMDRSIIWKLNEIFWKHYDLWEKMYGENYETSLPEGISESHKPEFIKASAERFIHVYQNHKQNKIYVFEQGPGSGIFAKGFIDYIEKHKQDLYKKLTYLLVDTSQEILTSCNILLTKHKDHIKFFTLEDFEKESFKFTKKILFARHSNIWDQFPCRAIKLRNTGLAEVYVKAVCGKGFDTLLNEISEKGLEKALVMYPQLWKEFFRSIKLQTRTIACDTTEIQANIYLQKFKDIVGLHAGKNTLYSDAVVENLNFLNTLIDWNKGGYIEIVDVMTPGPQFQMYPLKYDGAIGYRIDQGIIKTWAKEANKRITFMKLKKSNTLVTIEKNPDNVNFMQNASFEIFPEKTIAEKMKVFPKNTHVAVTCTSGLGIEHTIEKTLQLRKEGYYAYPHIIARFIKDRNHLLTIKNILTKNNMNEIFIAAGDVPHPHGNISSAVELLKEFKKIGIPFDKLYVTGYPEGHPHITSAKLVEALQQKQAFAIDNNIDTKIITQLCFDANTIVEWAFAMKNQGITLPIKVGIPGPYNMVKLLQFSMKCGVGDSVRFLRAKTNLGYSLGKQIIAQYKPDELMSQVIAHPHFEKTNIVGFHFYTFNNLEEMVKWYKKDAILQEEL